MTTHKQRFALFLVLFFFSVLYVSTYLLESNIFSTHTFSLVETIKEDAKPNYDDIDIEMVREYLYNTSFLNSNQIGVVEFSINKKEHDTTKSEYSYLDSPIVRNELLTDKTQRGLTQVKTNIIRDLGKYYFKKNHIDKALEHYLLALELEAKGKSLWYVTLYIEIGVAYKKKQDYESAKEYFQKALSLYYDFPEATSLYSYSKLAELYYEVGAYKEALLFADSVSYLAKAMNKGQRSAFLYRAISYYELEEYEQTLLNADSILTYSSKYEIEYEQALILKANALLELKKYNESENIFSDLFLCSPNQKYKDYISYQLSKIHNRKSNHEL